MENFKDNNILEFLSEPEGLSDEEINEELERRGVDPEQSQRKTIDFLRKLVAQIKIEKGRMIQNEFDRMSDNESEGFGVNESAMAIAFRNKTGISKEDEENFKKDKLRMEALKKIKRGRYE